MTTQTRTSLHIQEEWRGPLEVAMQRLDDLMERLKAELNLDHEQYGRILVALMEALNNAYVHGNGSNPDQPIRIEVKYEKALLEIRVQDDGNGFDYVQVLNEQPMEQLLESERGRGLFIIKRLVDDLQFADGGRTICLCFRIH